MGGVLFLINKFSGSHSKDKSSRSESGTTKEFLPYSLKKYFFTRSESVFYRELKEQLGNRYDIFPKVRIIDFVDVIPGAPNYSSWRNKIWSKHVDFLLCEKETHTPVIAIEVNGGSHNTAKAIARDAFVADIYETVDIKFVVVSVGSSFAEEIVKIGLIKTAEV